MNFVIAAPAYVQAAAADLANIASAISSANVAALTPTTAIIPAGADSVSTELAALFGLHGQMYQALSAQAAMFHNQFVELMNAGGAQYALAEAANVAPLQAGEEAINAPVSLATGQGMVGDGADRMNPVNNGRPGGWLYGNGAAAASGQAPATGGSGGLIGSGAVGAASAAAGGSGGSGGLLPGTGGNAGLLPGTGGNAGLLPGTGGNAGLLPGTGGNAGLLGNVPAGNGGPGAKGFFAGNDGLLRGDGGAGGLSGDGGIDDFGGVNTLGSVNGIPVQGGFISNGTPSPVGNALNPGAGIDGAKVGAGGRGDEGGKSETPLSHQSASGGGWGGKRYGTGNGGGQLFGSHGQVGAPS